MYIISPGLADDVVRSLGAVRPVLLLSLSMQVQESRYQLFGCLWAAYFAVERIGYVHRVILLGENLTNSTIPQNPTETASFCLAEVKLVG